MQRLMRQRMWYTTRAPIHGAFSIIHCAADSFFFYPNKLPSALASVISIPSVRFVGKNSSPSDRASTILGYFLDELVSANPLDSRRNRRRGKEGGRREASHESLASFRTKIEADYIGIMRSVQERTRLGEEQKGGRGGLAAVKGSGLFRSAHRSVFRSMFRSIKSARFLRLNSRDSRIRVGLG